MSSTNIGEEVAYLLFYAKYSGCNVTVSVSYSSVLAHEINSVSKTVVIKAVHNMPQGIIRNAGLFLG